MSISYIDKIFLKEDYIYIDEVFVNHIISNILNNNNFYIENKYLEKVIQAFCYNKLRYFDTSYQVKIIEGNVLDKMSKIGSVNAIIKENIVYLKKELVYALKDKDITILETIFHEVQHAKQRYMLENNTIDYKSYLLAMEQIIISEMNKG